LSERIYDLPGAVGCLIAIGIGAAALWFSADFSDLGAVFPRTIGALLVLLGVLYLLLVLLGRTSRPAPLGGSHLRRAGVAIVMLGWAFLLKPLGFLGSSALAFVALLMLANHYRWTARTGLVYGAAGAVLLGGFYALFKLVLLVPLP